MKCSILFILLVVAPYTHAAGANATTGVGSSWRAPASAADDLANQDQGVDDDTARQLIAHNLGTFQECYSNELERNPKAQGKVLLEWSLSADGKITSARIKESKIKSTEMSKCMVERVKSLKFPAPANKKASTYSYPFIFVKTNSRKDY